MNSNGESHSYLPDAQPDLFGMPSQSDPLSSRTPASYSEERKAARDRAFDRADRLMLDRYSECLRLVGRAKSTFGAWDVTKVYQEKHGELTIHGKEALGALFAHLLHAGMIEEASFGKRPNHNVGPVYRLKN